jgi:hypothetical protein
MGGIGSGGWRARSRWRTTLEDLPTVDVARWLRAGVLTAGSLFEQSLSICGASCGSIGVAVLSDSEVCMFYTAASEPDLLVRIDVELRWTACQLGGRRPWFACPRCCRQCGKLYLRKQWACRHCCALPYRSQTLTSSDRLLHRAHKLRRRLETFGPSSTVGPRWGMRQSTREHLSSQIARLEYQSRRLALRAFLGVGGELGRYQAD